MSGEIFENLPKELLCKSPFFEAMFNFLESNENVKKDEKGYILLERDPVVFQCILDHLASDGQFSYEFNSDEERKKFEEEIDFFCLPNFIEKLQEIFDSDPDQ